MRANWWGNNHLLVLEYFMWRQGGGLSFWPTLLAICQPPPYSLSEYTSFIIVSNRFRVFETEMGNTSTSASKSGVYKSGFLLFPHSNRFHPVSFS